MAEKTAEPKVLRIGHIVVDLDSGELRDRSSMRRLQDKPLQLLTLLAEYAGLVVSREQIRESIWGPSRYHDFEDSLNQAVRKLREALGETASEPRLLHTIPRRGYRLVIPAEPVFKDAARPARVSATTVGRDRELAALETAFAAACDGRGHMFCISGEPGIGKTTLAETFIHNVGAREECRIAIGRCSEMLSGTEAYLPVIECLESLLAADGAHAGEILRQAAPSWFAELPQARSEFGPAPDPGPATQERRKREFVTFLEQLSRNRALVIVIEDVHWADPSTVDLLSYAAARCGSMRVMIVATFRSSDLVRTGHPFLGLKLELQAHRLCQELELGPLSRVDVEKYIAAVFADNAFPADFAHSIYQRTEGSPLFVADLLRDLVHNEVVATVRGRWALARPLSELEGVLPESVRGMVERQISKLDARQRQLLEIAAVEGYEFSSAILARVAERDEAEIEEALDQIRQRHRLICSRGERNLPGSGLTSRYAFSHVLYQNALAAGLGPAKRISLSAAVAQAVRQGWSGHENEVAAQLAYLYERARDWRQAAEFFTLAARGASRLSGYREAIELSMRAMSVAGQLEGEPRLRGELAAQMQLAFARQARSEFSEAAKAYMSAAATAAELRDAGEQIEALCGAAFAAGYLKQTGKMHEYASHALDLAKGSGSPTGYPESVLAFCALFLGDLETADKQRHAVASLRETGPPSARIFAANSLALLLVMRSEYEEAERLINESLVEMRSAHCWPDLLRASWFQGMALGNGGKVGEALSVLEKAKRLCELNGERFWYSRYPNTLGWLYGELADIDSAVRLNTEGIRAGEDADTPETIANSHINLANIYAGQGQFERAYKHICEGERVLERADHKHWLRWRFTIRLEIETANYFAAAGDAAQAGKLASSALARAEHARARKHVAVAHKLLGDAAMLRGRADESVREYDAALEVLKKYPCPLLKCKVLLAAWRACSVTGDRVRADRMLASYGKVVQLVAASIHDEQLRERFLQSKLVRSAGSAS